MLVHASSPDHSVPLLSSSAWPTQTTVCVMATFWAVILVLYHLPGSIASGPVTPCGHIPKYVDNGLAHMSLFVSLFIGGAVAELYPLSILYDELFRIVFTLNILALLFCVYLYVKGRTHPSTPDVTFSGRGVLYDFYAGIELYPRIFGVDVKKIVNCRFSMTFWMVFGISATAASFELHDRIDHGLLCCAVLTFLYLVTFFMWEIGYMRSIDIIEDNAGFMETWGCLVFVPAVYTNHMHCAVRTPSDLSPQSALLVGGFGLFCITMTYWINRQRQVFRETGGVSMLWWPTAPEALRVEYTVKKGEALEKKQSLLLVNGFWGVVRHPQYVFELGIALSWGLATNPFLRRGQSLLYFAFLTVLLFHRAHRDAIKCKAKYGDGYVDYVRRVPYMVIPGVF